MDPLTRFLRRRRRELGVALATLVVLVLGAGLVLPEEHVALASISPNGPGYVQPVARYLAEVDSAGLLRALADPEPVPLSARLAGVPSAPEERLRADGWGQIAQVRNDQTHAVEIEVRVQGLNRAEALRVADGVAAEIVRLDRSNFEQPQSAPLQSQTAAQGRTRASLQQALNALRAAQPGLSGAQSPRAASLAQEQSEWERRREAEQGLEARLTQELSHVDELERRVLAEARAAWTSHKDELLARAREAARASRPPGEHASPAARPLDLGPLAALEAELRLLLASRTVRHPEVRNLLRRIDLERARAGANGAPAGALEIPADAPGALPPEPAGALPAPGASTLPGTPEPTPGDEFGPAPDAPSAPEGQTEDVARGLVFEAADDDAPGGGPDEGPEGSLVAAPAQPLPREWIQRAPSYSEWTGARDRAARTRADLESALSQSAAMRARLDRAERQLGLEQAELAAAQAEEARLLELLRLAPAAVEVVPASPLPRPHLQASPARLLSAWRPSDYLIPGLCFAALSALLLAWWIDWRDPAIHEIEGVAGFGVPVLGVIPHLK